MLLTVDVLFAVALYSVPMIISPGPGNTILAAAGARFGVLGTLPFWTGFESANLFWCLAYGFGLSAVLTGHPSIAETLKWMGVGYTLYLAYTFLRSSAPVEGTKQEKLTFFDGFLSVTLNPKIHQMIFILFSQFLPSAENQFLSVAQITALFLVLCVVCHAPWIVGGKLIFSTFKSEAALRLQGYIFAGCMILVALYVALN
jgi:homoserine/homoserine lactone efflux protein